jgi:hypothetical protein
VAPFSVAAIVAVPPPTPVTVTVALDAPAGTVTGDGTVATAVLLLAIVMLTALEAAAFSATVACTVVPAVTVVALSVTPDTAAVSLGAVDDFEHCATANARASVMITLMTESPRLDTADNNTVVLVLLRPISPRYTGCNVTRVHKRTDEFSAPAR